MIDCVAGDHHGSVVPAPEAVGAELMVTTEFTDGFGPE